MDHPSSSGIDDEIPMDLVRLLHLSSLFSKNSERESAIQCSDGSLTEEHCKLIVELGNSIHPHPRKNLSMFQKKKEEHALCIKIAKEWTDLSNSDQRINSLTNVTHKELHREVQKILNSSYMAKEASLPNYVQATKIGVLWDHELCPLPSNFHDYSKIRTNITKALEKMGFTIALDGVEIFAIGDDIVLKNRHPMLMQHFAKENITHVNAPHELRDRSKVVSDKRMFIETLNWADNHLFYFNEPTIVVAITNDPDFRWVVEELMGKGFYVVVVHDRDAENLLYDEVKKTVVGWDGVRGKAAIWDAFIEGRVESLNP